VLISNISLTLQNPTGRIGTPFSSMRNAPQDPGPVSTGERIAVRLSWPLPLDQRARHAVQNLGVSSVIEIEQTRKTMVRRGKSRVRDRGEVCCMRIKNSWTG
jgi:hypothetical protein